jgi:energy-coupling factor transporter ATP-binding protein EcfA2
MLEVMCMIKLIVGKKGSGKTKLLISMVNEAIKKSDGKIVCIDKGAKLTYDINHGARLLDTDSYNIFGCDSLYGFLAGVAAGDFDTKEVYVDSVLKICGDEISTIPNFINKVEALSIKENVDFIFAISAETEELPEVCKRYIA